MPTLYSGRDNASVAVMTDRAGHEYVQISDGGGSIEVPIELASALAAKLIESLTDDHISVASLDRIADAFEVPISNLFPQREAYRLVRRSRDLEFPEDAIGGEAR